MKVGIFTLGCKVNAYESEYVLSLFKEKGYEIGNFTEVCDIYIINTCSVTNTSDAKSRKMIHQAIRRNPDACVVAMGCFIEANKDIHIDGVDILIGNKDKSKIVSLVEEYFENKKEIRNLYKDLGTEFENMEIHSFEGRTRAFVKIQDGCENYCTYCIIPYVRGKCRSKDMNEVLEEIGSLVRNHYQEVVLTGIHTGNYGSDKNYNFADLLSKIVKIDGLKRLRISSIEICEITDEVLQIISESNVIVNHLHIPLQAGSNKVLRDMERKYNIEYYLEIIEKIRKIRPNIAISTDIIVGFPTEDDKDFNNTLEISKKIGFSKIHVFPFSLRSGTKAEGFQNIVSSETKKERAKKLLDLSKKLEIEYMNKFINKEVEVLIESKKAGYSYGHTSNFLYVKIKKELENNTFHKVVIKSIEYPYVIGE